MAKHELNAEPLIQLTQYLKSVAGIERLRITGGEPLIAPQFDDFILAVAKLEFDDISITTNGEFLEKKIAVIKEAGIKRINVSLDTLDTKAFKRIAKAGELAAVLKGIDLLLTEGIAVKINTVPLLNDNLDQVLPLLDFSLARGIELRFIELMRMGHLSQAAEFNRHYVPMDYLLKTIAGRYSFVRSEAPYDSTSARFTIPGKGVFGVIANESEPFCSTCTRLRLSSSGYLHGCLSSSNKHYIADILTLPEPEAKDQLNRILGRAMADKQPLFRGGETVMRVIGG